MAGHRFLRGNLRGANHGLGAPILALILAAACAAPPSSPPELATGSVSPDSVEDDACNSIELRTPSGSRVDLTGSWRAVESVHYVRQVGGCVWWVALSDVAGQELGGSGVLIFHGGLRPDFTLRGEWMYVLRPPFSNAPPRGTATFIIDVSFVDGVETINLRQADPVEDEGPYESATLTYEGPLPPTR